MMGRKGEEGRNICPAAFCLSRDGGMQGRTRVGIKQKGEEETSAGMESQEVGTEGLVAEPNQASEHLLAKTSLALAVCDDWT